MAYLPKTIRKQKYSEPLPHDSSGRVLHNLCVDANEYYTKAWEVREGVTEEERERFTDPLDDSESLHDARRTRGSAKRIQKALCDHMMHNFHVGWQPRSREEM